MQSKMSLVKMASGMSAGDCFKWNVHGDVTKKSSASQGYLPVLGIAGTYDGHIK